MIIYKDPISVKDYLEKHNYSCRIYFYNKNSSGDYFFFKKQEVLNFYVISAIAFDSHALYLKVSYEPPKS